MPKVNIDDYEDQFVDICGKCGTPIEETRGFKFCPKEDICICGKFFHVDEERYMNFCSSECEAGYREDDF